MPTLKILSAFTPVGGAPAIVAEREPSEGEIVRNAQGAEFYWTAPMAAAPNPPPPRALTPNQVIDRIVAVIGGAAFVAAWNDASLALWRIKMEVARDITKAQADAGLAALVTAGAITSDNKTAILAAWPTA